MPPMTWLLNLLRNLWYYLSREERHRHSRLRMIVRTALINGDRSSAIQAIHLLAVELDIDPLNPTGSLQTEA